MQTVRDEQKVMKGSGKSELRIGEKDGEREREIERKRRKRQARKERS